MNRAVVLAILGLLGVPPVAAQSTTGSISGTVVDSSAAPVVDVRVVVTRNETGVRRVVATGPRGLFRVLDLPPGVYSVRMELRGFNPVKREDVLVAIGTDSVVNVTLQMSALDEEVVVSGEAVVLSAGSSAAGGVVTQNQIEGLPLNGRNFLQLASLQPGVVVSRGTGQEFTGGFGSTQLSVAGGRPEQTGYLLDGTNIADISDKAPSSLAGVMLGVDAVQEFSVQTHGYSAEFGRAAGGIVSAVTRSGTNVMRGSAFIFHRDSALDARNYFAPEDPPDFLRNQFGGSLGGPIVENRLFYFGSYEGLRARNVVTQAARLPDAAAHAGLLPGPDGTLRDVGVHPQVRPYLDLLFPVPDGQNFGDGTAELRHTERAPIDEDLFVTRVDWQAGSQDSLMVRFTGDSSTAEQREQHPLFVHASETGTRYFTAQHQRLFGASAMNTLRFGRNLTRREHDVQPTVTIPQSLYFTEDPHFGAINIIGQTLVGSEGTIPARYQQTIYQVADTVTISRGDHLWKLGVDWQHYRFEGVSYSRYGGEFRFRGLEEFLTLERSSTAQADRFTGNLPGTDTLRHVTQDYLAFFVQDEWRVRNDVTLSLGLRYDFVTTPEERDGLIAGLLSLDDLESGPQGVTPGAPLFDNPSGRSLAPRLGVAWNPGDSRTRVRGGYGLFYQPLTVSFYRGTLFRIFPYFAGVDIRQPVVFGPGIQEVLANASDDVRRRSEFIDYDIDQPFMQQWHVQIDRDLGAGVTAELGYLGSRGHNLPFYGDPNAIPAEVGSDGRKRVIPGASIRYPSWGRIRTRTTDARSRGHALVAGLRRRTMDGVTLQAAYTFANSKDTWSGGLQGSSDYQNGPGGATYWWDPEAEFGPSNFDVRHTLVVNVVYELPWGRDLTGVAGLLGRGWTVSGLLQLASGLPVTPIIGFDRAGDEQSDADEIQKPDLVGSLGYPATPEAWFDVSAFALPPAGTYGNAPRNSIRGPGLKIADMAAFKSFEIGRFTTQIRLEAFNVFNWVNFGLPDATALFDPDGTYRPGSGRITRTATPARQLQLGVKLIF